MDLVSSASKTSVWNRIYLSKTLLLFHPLVRSNSIACLPYLKSHMQPHSPRFCRCSVQYVISSATCSSKHLVLVNVKCNSGMILGYRAENEKKKERKEYRWHTICGSELLVHFFFGNHDCRGGRQIYH